MVPSTEASTHCRKPKVWAALSGGVDSATAAALLVEQGYEVVGVFMELLECAFMPEGDRRTCCSPRDKADAQMVADHLRIPFRVVDLKEVFRRKVIEDFVEEYRKGRTPNPCIRCNQWIKFGALMDMALGHGARVLATGHYARVWWDPVERCHRLLKGKDPLKDQSYFLFPMGQGRLSKVVWPLGDYNKDDVRELAFRFGLPVADKEESQEICFIPGGDYRGFLKEYLGDELFGPGNIVDTSGRVLGTHHGIHHFTVGQRRGLGVPWREPLYVIRILPDTSTVVVGPKSAVLSRALWASNTIWPAGDPPGSSFRATARIRYRHKEAPAFVEVMGEDRIKVTFDEPQTAITPGQAVVIYRGDELVGGGWIDRALDGDDV